MSVRIRTYGREHIINIVKLTAVLEAKGGRERESRARESERARERKVSERRKKTAP